MQPCGACLAPRSPEASHLPNWGEPLCDAGRKRGRKPLRLKIRRPASAQRRRAGLRRFVGQRGAKESPRPICRCAHDVLRDARPLSRPPCDAGRSWLQRDRSSGCLLDPSQSRPASTVGRASASIAQTPRCYPSRQQRSRRIGVNQQREAEVVRHDSMPADSRKTPTKRIDKIANQEDRQVDHECKDGHRQRMQRAQALRPLRRPRTIHMHESPATSHTPSPL